MFWTRIKERKNIIDRREDWGRTGILHPDIHWLQVFYYVLYLAVGRHFCRLKEQLCHLCCQEWFLKVFPWRVRGDEWFVDVIWKATSRRMLQWWNSEVLYLWKEAFWGPLFHPLERRLEEVMVYSTLTRLKRDTVWFGSFIFNAGTNYQWCPPFPD